MLYHCFASFKQSLLDFFKLGGLATHTHRRRSDWNSGGRMAGLTIKSCYRGKKHIFLHCNASYLVLKILQHDKIMTIRRSKFWGDLSSSPPRDLRPCSYLCYCMIIIISGVHQWQLGCWDDWSEKVKLRGMDYVAYKCVSALFCWKTKLLSAMCLVAINILLRW